MSMLDCLQQQSLNYRDGYCSRAAVHKPLITEMNAHLSLMVKPQALVYREESDMDNRWVNIL